MKIPLHGPFACLLVTAAATAQWQLAAPSAAPSARGDAGMAFHPPSGNVLLFGGSTGFVASNQTWSFDGTNWSQLQPLASPPAAAGMELVHDALRGVVVMYGGVNTSPFGGASVDQTWEFDGATWTQRSTVVTPGGLGHYGACFDLLRARLVLYGGTPDTFFPIAANGTWEYDGTNWAQVATTASPGPLERPAMCYHLGIGRTVLFGGIDPQTGGVDTTWLYDGTTWTAAPIVGSRPAARTGAAMVYDSDRQVCVLTGGLDPNTGNPLLDTWEFDGVAWRPVPTAPSARFAAGLAYQESTRRVVLFGGAHPLNGSLLGDTWDCSRSLPLGTGCTGSFGVPTLAAVAGPRLGQSHQQTLGNLDPVLPLAVLVLSLTPLPATSLAAIGMSGCNAYMTPDVLLTVAATAGTATVGLAIPNTPSLVGVSLLSQGIGFDAVNAAGLVTSNGLDGRIGR